MRDDLYHEILGAEDEGIVLTDVGRAYMRDRFAMAALKGILASGAKGSPSKDPHEAVSIAAYAVADAMLAERERAK